jgi:hypothetical protein
MPALSNKAIAGILAQASREYPGGGFPAMVSKSWASQPEAVATPGAGDVPVPSTPEQLAAYENARQEPLEKLRYTLKNNLLSGGATDIRNMMMGATPPTAGPSQFALGPALDYLRGGLSPSFASGTPVAQRGALSLAQKAEIASQNANVLQEAENLPIAARLMKEYNALPPGTPRAVKAKMERLIAEAIGSGVQPGWHPENFGVSQLLGHVSQGPNALSALAKGALSGIH